MMAKTYSAQVVGLKADLITVEVDISKGLHSFTIVGLPDKAVEEAKDRINAAIKNSGFKAPQKGNRKIVVSLAPADIRKEGSAFDLAIALASLLALGSASFQTEGKLFLGELALDGGLRPVRGALLLTDKAKRAGFTEIFLPAANAVEAALIEGVTIYGCNNLLEIVRHLAPTTVQGETTLLHQPLAAQPPTAIRPENRGYDLDFADVKSQETAKRGLEIAAAGGHNIALSGPPGTGKTMLARAFAGILPPLAFNEIIEVTGIYSAAGVSGNEVVVERPFRSPHHTSSYVSVVGGGTWPKPGEITLAHRGVLFLDEFPEFDKKVIESLRQPLEDRLITVARARGTIVFPANFILIAAMNPCPCGQRGSKERECLCSPTQLFRYQRKLSGPIIDRIDLWIEVPNVDYRKLSDTADELESSATVRERTVAAKTKQVDRFKENKLPGKTNSSLSARELKVYCPLSEGCVKLLNDSARRLNLSARAYHRIIKIARTIADLADARDISETHLLEALQYRPKSLEI